VESGLVAFERSAPPAGNRADVFALIDAAFAQRRKMLRSALAGWAGGVDSATEVLERAAVAPTARGEQLSVTQFAAIAAAAKVKR
jgi:16S rRNA (adenine1518-N6/adenine1519-N6)-dimethyltransferase